MKKLILFSCGLFLWTIQVYSKSTPKCEIENAVVSDLYFLNAITYSCVKGSDFYYKQLHAAYGITVDTEKYKGSNLKSTMDSLANVPNCGSYNLLDCPYKYSFSDGEIVKNDFYDVSPSSIRDTAFMVVAKGLETFPQYVSWGRLDYFDNKAWADSIKSANKLDEFQKWYNEKFNDSYNYKFILSELSVFNPQIKVVGETIYVATGLAYKWSDSSLMRLMKLVACLSVGYFDAHNVMTKNPIANLFLSLALPLQFCKEQYPDMYGEFLETMAASNDLKSRKFMGKEKEYSFTEFMETYMRKVSREKELSGENLNAIINQM